MEQARALRRQKLRQERLPAIGSHVAMQAVLHCHGDPDPEARARLFYEANREAMDV